MNILLWFLQISAADPEVSEFELVFFYEYNFHKRFFYLTFVKLNFTSFLVKDGLRFLFSKIYTSRQAHGWGILLTLEKLSRARILRLLYILSLILRTFVLWFLQ